MRAAWAALKATGVLAPAPLPAAAGLLWQVARHGPTLYALVAWHAQRTPARMALSGGHESMTFAELQARADHVAACLRPYTPPGTVVALPAGDGLPFVAALMAGLRLGLRVVLLPPGQDESATACLLARLNVQALLTDDPGLAGLGVPCLSLHRSPAQRFGPGWPRAGRLVLLTSGTTGEPRPVTRRVKPLAAGRLMLALLAALRPHQDAPVLLPLPLWHGHGLATLALCLALGTRLHLCRGTPAAELWAVMTRQGTQILVLVPTLLRRLMDAPGSAPSLRTVVCGSAPLDPALARRTQARLGPALHNLYGSTETGLISLATPDDLCAVPDSVGRPLPGVRVRRAADGQLQVSGLLTRQWLNTGDLGSLDGAGRLHLVGRADDLMVIGGENIWPAQLEAALLGLPGVRACAVFPVACAEYGQRPAAFVELEPGVSAARLQAALAARLPWRLRPAPLTVVPELPLTPSGKVARTVLKAWLNQEEPAGLTEHELCPGH
ncbi:fatty acid--CoA ligase family protein [Deinococcus sp. HMF7604]|uniref:class I adenylate-forming enzyme family protein n=1 Tax=Deinococcus betulae TaxID=2873312 RepID=UPI001CCCB7BF|nr:fatty acid--CoA ligase family protein [Deinococcus betulae]